MKLRTIFSVTIMAICGGSNLMAQTNTFPSSGYVGIGTTTPFAKLEVNSGSILVKNLANTTGESLPMITQSLTFGHYATFGTSINTFTENDGYNSYALQFLTQETYVQGLVEKMRISAAGNVGIGVDNPLHVLHLKKPQPTLNFEKTGVLNWTMGNIAGNDFYIRVDNAPNSPFMMESNTGNVGIGTATPKEKLSVNGKIRAKEIKVELANWPDYVFEEGYQKLSLTEIEQFIKQNKHLPGVPIAKQVEQEGVELGEMNKVLLKKIEELTLLLIEKDKELKKEKDENNARLNEIEKWIKNKK